MIPLSDAVIVALITGACAIIGQLLITKASSKDMMTKLEKQSEIDDLQLDSKLEKRIAVIDTKIEELTREVREHNEFARRVPVLEEKVKQLGEKKGA